MTCTSRSGAAHRSQRIVRGQRIDLGRAALEQGFGDVVAAGAHDRLAVQFLHPDRAVPEIDVKILAHVDVTPQMKYSDSDAAVFYPFRRHPVPAGWVRPLRAWTGNGASALFICRVMLTLIKGAPIPGD